MKLLKCVKYYFVLVFILIVSLLKNTVAQWTSEKYALFYNNSEFNLKGINHFGFETPNMAPHGYDYHDIDYYLDFLQKNNFNALRLPFSYEFSQNMYNDFLRPEVVSKITDKTCTKNPADLLKCIFSKAKDRGIFIMLDWHTIDYKIQEKPYGRLTKDQFYQSWDAVIDIAIQYPNFMAIDMQNECHGVTTWNDYGTAINDFVVHINTKYPDYKGLIFFEGLQDVYDAAWGGSFALMDHVINMNNKLVFSPHAYGPSVRGQSTYGDGENNFDRWFGYLKTLFDNAIVIGEYGGYYNLDQTNQDYWWHNRLVDYLIKINQRNTFYWCLNPDSSDTKGILYDDWTYPNYQKLTLLEKLQPNPTKIVFPNNKRNLRNN